MVRTPGFQPDNTGPTPVGATLTKTTTFTWLFLLGRRPRESDGWKRVRNLSADKFRNERRQKRAGVAFDAAQDNERTSDGE